MAREFMIERYGRGLWPALRGDVPFLATGPRFHDWTVRQSGPFWEHRFRPELTEIIAQIAPTDEPSRKLYGREAAAELLLWAGIVQALWVTHSTVASDDRYRTAISELAAELPYPTAGSLADWVIEYLSGLCDPAHHRHMVVEDGLVLEPMAGSAVL